MVFESDLLQLTPVDVTQTNDGDEPQEDLRPHDQQCDEITVLPNGFIPIVMNPKFEFVPFESRLEEDENPMVARIDIN